MSRVSTAYLLTCAAIGVAGGVLLWGATALSTLLFAVVPFFSVAIAGLWLLPAVVALRLLAPYYGLTLETNTMVIGLALTAIAAGTWAGGWSADRVAPRRLLGPLLGISGAAVALTPTLVRGAAASGDPGLLLITATLSILVPGALLSAVRALADKIASRAPLAVRAAKRALREGADLPLAQALDLESELWGGLFATADQKEGMRAFVEKRPPNFQGR